MSSPRAPKDGGKILNYVESRTTQDEHWRMGEATSPAMQVRLVAWLLLWGGICLANLQQLSETSLEGLEATEGSWTGLRRLVVLDSPSDARFLSSVCSGEVVGNQLSPSSSGNKVEVSHLVCAADIASGSHVSPAWAGPHCHYSVHGAAMLCAQEREQYQSLVTGNYFWRFLVQDYSSSVSTISFSGSARSETWEMDVVLHHLQQAQVVVVDPQASDGLLSYTMSILPRHETPVIVHAGSDAAAMVAHLSTLPQRRMFTHEDPLPPVHVTDASSALLLERAAWAGTQARAHASTLSETETEAVCAAASVSVTPRVRSLLSSMSEGRGETQGAPGTKVLCMTYTHAPRMANAAGIAASWGARCDGYLAFTDDDMGHAFGIVLESPNWTSGGEEWSKENYDNMWFKTALIWSIAGNSRLLGAFDYFLVGGDDLYVHVGHLRSLLESPAVAARTAAGLPLYMGRVGRQNAYLHSFNMGGAGYVLNRASVSEFVRLINIGRDTVIAPASRRNPCVVGIRTAMEDLMVAHCLHHAGIDPWVPSNADLAALLGSSTAAASASPEGVGNHIPDEALFLPWHLDQVGSLQHAVLASMTNTTEGVTVPAANTVSFQDVKTVEEMRCIHALLF